MAKYPPKNGKRALVTGITGQDGSYLAELLLAKGYEVYGTLRRSSSLNTGRINHIYQDPHDSDVRLRLEYSDLADGSSLNQLIKTIGPHEIYNLGAQSHVRVSFDVPEYTSDITGLGCIRLLEAIRETGVTCRFYQASSSELYGKVVETPQTERTPFYPRSPYACAKAFAFYATRNYRESYGMFAVNGILFNHETVAGNTPMIFKHEDEVEFDIKPISEIVSDELCSGGPTIVDESRPEYQGGMPTRAVLVWDREGFTRIKYASAYPHRPDEEPKDPRLINARKSAVMATGSHGFIMADGDEKSASQLQIGDRVALCPFPEGANSPAPYADGEAFLLGKMAADGWISRDARRAKFTSASAEARQEFANLWQSLGGTSRFNPTVSGFSGKPVGQLVLNGRADWLRAIDLYNRELTPFGHRTKRVPRAILNAPIATQREFLRGYNSGDGLKSNPCQYEFRNFKTNSATLALGLVYLVHRVTGQDYNVTVEESDAHGKTQFYYSLNLLSDQLTSEDKADVVRELVAAGSSQRGVARESGISRTFIRKIQQGGAPRTIHHLKRPGDEVKKIIDMPQYAGWFYDLETESGTFHCGVGQGHVHNSPRRGETFVTRKITRAAARIADGKQECLYLGNLDARRDWGFAGDYVDAMWRMLQVEEPEDFVIATGEMHSVREFCDLSFGMLGMPLEWRGGGIEEVGVDQAGKMRVRVDARYFRPAEVDLLLGDASYALAKLGWKPTVSFKELVQMMVESDRALTAAP